MLKLYGSTGSPYVRKVRIVLAEKKLEYEYILEDVWSEDSTITSLNPLGKIPCLLMDDHTPIYDSRVIVEYLDTLSPVTNLIAQTGRQRTEAKRWEALADGVCDAAIIIRRERTERSPEQQLQSVIDRQMKKIDAALIAMNAQLGDHPYCMGNSFGVADIAVVCALDYLAFRMPEITWQQKHPNLLKLADKLAVRPSFAATQPH